MQAQHLVPTLRVGTQARTLCVLLASALLLPTAPATAQTALRWNLKPGDALEIHIDQHTDSTVSFSGKKADTSIDLSLVLGWNVAATDNAGFKIRQSIVSIRQKLTTQQAGVVEFDSSSKTKPTGQSRELADALRPLVGADFDILMTPRGEITSVEPANDAAKSLLAGLENAAATEAAARATVEQMLRRPLIVLPEKAIGMNESWTVSSERPTVAGPLKIDTTYTLTGVSPDTNPVARIAMTAAFTAAPGGQVTVKAPQHSGEVEFSISEGRLLKIAQQQKLTTERPYRETTILVTLASQQTTVVSRK